uniref:acetamidase/formamidase family protein n=1 Tax=Saccharibacillus sp. CPCC 101409 TaxID=3058041 RepID=UPI0034A0A752
MIHRIEFNRQSLIGSLTAEVEPLLRIQSGDTLRFAAPDAGWGVGESWAKRTKPVQRETPYDGGHGLIGPFYIEGSQPGMTLAIRFNEIVPGSYGFTSAGGYPNWQNQMLKLTDIPDITLDWTLDAASATGTCSLGGRDYTVSLRPFMGLIGMPPSKEGVYDTWPPRFCGGNIDCRELIAGSVLYLPVPVAGGYLSIGDGHAAQGDGEVSCQAIECPMDLVDVTVTLLPQQGLTLPRAETPAGWITFGFHEDLNEATVQALDGMLDLMGEQYGLSRVEAIGLGSAVIDLRITQIVNGVKGVHALLPHGAFR